MLLLFALFLTLPQDYVNLVMDGKYDEAIVYCDKMITKSSGATSFKWQMEKGDLYFDKLHDLDEAVEIYQHLVDSYPAQGGFWIFSKRHSYPDLGLMYLRLGQALEMHEDYLNAAKTFEVVATRFRTPPLDSFALNGVERCFKKNYQDYVATIDGYNITRLELDEKSSGGSPYMKRDEKTVLDQMILERLIFANAVKYKIQETDFFKENIADRRRVVMLEEVRQSDIIATATPTASEMKQFYRERIEDYKAKEEVRGKEIVVESDSLARFILDSLKKDLASFDSLAKKYSTANSRNSGGNMGAVNRGVKPKPVEDAIFAAKPKTLTDIVQFDNNFGIYLVTEHLPERYRTFEEVKGQVESLVKVENTKMREQELMNRLRAKSKIQYFNEETVIPIDSMAAYSDLLFVVLNNRKLTMKNLEKTNQNQPTFARLDLTKPNERKQLLKTMVDQELQLEWAEKNKYFLHDGYFNRMHDEITGLMDRGLYMKIVVEGVKVDSQEVMDYYKKHREEFKIPESIRGKEITVNSKTLANELYNMLVQIPGRIDSLAKEHSTAPTKRSGGDTGMLRKGMRPKAFDDVIFKMKPGELSKVFALNDTAYCMVELLEHTPERFQTVEEVYQRLDATLLREKQRKTADDFIAGIKSEANVQILLDKPLEPALENKEEIKE